MILPDPDNKRELQYIDIIRRYGYELQYTVAMEECAELIQAISKRLRKADDGNGDLIGEMADVIVMIEQMMVINKIDIDDIDEVIEQKLERMR